MKTIGIIGSNGQVGAEVSLFLSQWPDVNVVPISRTLYGSSFLRNCGLECRCGSLSSANETRELTRGCDLVADFSVPRGTPPQVRRIMRENITRALENSPDARQYVYISSHAIFRESSTQPRYRSYAHAKRQAERAARNGARFGKEIYVLRLGQVHGILQRITHSYLSQLRDEEAVLPDIPSFTVFAYSIAEALSNIALGKEKPGTYTLVSVPAWTWPEVHEWYCRRAGIRPRYRLEAAKPETAGGKVLRSFREMLNPLQRAMFHQRELLNDVAASLAPDFAARIRAKHYVKSARTDLGKRRQIDWRPVNQEFEAPGTRLSSLSDSRTAMDEPTLKLERLLDTMLVRTRLSSRVAAQLPCHNK